MSRVPSLFRPAREVEEAISIMMRGLSAPRTLLERNVIQLGLVAAVRDQFGERINELDALVTVGILYGDTFPSRYDT